MRCNNTVWASEMAASFLDPSPHCGEDDEEHRRQQYENRENGSLVLSSCILCFYLFHCFLSSLFCAVTSLCVCICVCVCLVALSLSSQDPSIVVTPTLMLRAHCSMSFLSENKHAD